MLLLRQERALLVASPHRDPPLREVARPGDGGVVDAKAWVGRPAHVEHLEDGVVPPEGVPQGGEEAALADLAVPFERCRPMSARVSFMKACEMTRVRDRHPRVSPPI
eukprot:6098286-Prymnesium_polylepis.1